MPITPEDLSIPRASLSDSANIEEAVNPALERIAAIMAPQDQGPWSTIPAATAARKGMRYYATDRRREYVCTGTEWLLVDAPAPIVTALPTGANSYEGQVVAYQPVTDNPVYWSLRRVGNRWVPTGLPVSLYSFVGPPSSSSASLAWNAPVSSARLTVPADGYYEFEAFIAVGIEGDGTGRLYEIAPVRVDGSVVEPITATARNAFGGVQTLPQRGIAAGFLLRAGDDVRLAYRAHGWTGLPSYTVQERLLCMAPRYLLAS